MGAAAENRPVIGRWELEPDEALILEVEPPEGVYWSYSLGNPWWETIHYGRHQSSLNGHQAVVDSDGLLRVVLCGRDPGVANWLDTAVSQRRDDLALCADRDCADADGTSGAVRRIGSALPADTRMLTADERAHSARADARFACDQRLRTTTLLSRRTRRRCARRDRPRDFGSPYYREGLERPVAALNTEADLNDMGRVIQHATISNALIQRLKIEETYRRHPEIDDEVIVARSSSSGCPAPGRPRSASSWPPTRSSGRCGCGSRSSRRRRPRRPPSTPIRASRRPKLVLEMLTRCFR